VAGLWAGRQPWAEGGSQELCLSFDIYKSVNTMFFSEERSCLFRPNDTTQKSLKSFEWRPESAGICSELSMV